MKIAFITAGAAGMFCGSCMRDNTLVTALIAQGHEALLIPTYMPIRTDEIDVSEGKIFYGGINVYLQEKSWIFRHTPRWVDSLLNSRWLLKWASKKSVSVNYADFAELTISMLQGRDGRQKKELTKLVEWLQTEVRPEVVVLTNALLSGLVPDLETALKIPVLVTLQGDDIFLNALPEASRKRCLDQIRANDRHIAGYISTCDQYADEMAPYFGLARDKIHTIYPGIRWQGHSPQPTEPHPPTVGYFARICPEKGFHNLIDAYIHLRRTYPDVVKLRASGWLGPQYQAFYQTQLAKLREAGYEADFEYVESPDHASKVKFYHSVDVLSVPTDYHEPKGLSILEAWANGLPVVQPAHGSFPELIRSANAGRLYPPGDHAALAQAWHELLANPQERATLGQNGRRAVETRFSAETMAEETVKLLQKGVGG
ncbi:MAG: glycosyltransferase family 4 protein [Fimbriiglobus sp.]